MIYDLLKNIETYRGISKNLDTAISFLVRTDLNSLPEGRTDIDGDAVFVNVMNATPHELTEECFEIHKNYMDIQIDLEGCEVIGIGLGKFEALGEYKVDFQAVKAEMSTKCVMGPGRFIVCMIEEAHAPGGFLQEPETVKKCVIKVAKAEIA